MAKYWNRHNNNDRRAFAELLKPLVIASRLKTSAKLEFTASETSTYMLTLDDVPHQILIDAISKLLRDGITWMPRPGDIKAACADVVDAARRLAQERAKEFQQNCTVCAKDGWERLSVKGQWTVRRCECWRRGIALLDAAGTPIARPQLPAHDAGDAATT